MEINLQESEDLFKLANEIPNVKGNIILCEMSLLYQLYMLDDNLIPGHFATLILDEVQTTHLFCHNLFLNKKIKILCYASLRSSRLAVFLNIF